MQEPDNAPKGEWLDTPTPAPAAPEGQAPSAPQSSGGFDREAYLSTLPEDERDAKSSLPDAILEAERSRQMLRSDYDRKRGEETARLRSLEAQNAAIAKQNEQLLTLMNGGGGAKQEPAPTISDIGKKLYEADNPDDYVQGVAAIVQQTVAQSVAQAIESNPAIRRLNAGIALRQARSSADGYNEEDHTNAERRLSELLAARGARVDQLDPEVVQAFYEPVLEAVKARRELDEAKAGTATQRPAAPQRRSSLPVSGSGAGAATIPKGGKDPFGPKSTLEDRIKATYKQLGLTPQDVSAMIAKM